MDLAVVTGLVQPAERVEDEIRQVQVDPNPIDFAPATADDVAYGLWWYHWSVEHPRNFTLSAAESMPNPIPWKMPWWTTLGLYFGAAAVVPGALVAFAQWIKGGFDHRREYLEACKTRPLTYAEKVAGRRASKENAGHAH